MNGVRSEQVRSAHPRYATDAWRTMPLNATSLRHLPRRVTTVLAATITTLSLGTAAGALATPTPPTPTQLAAQIKAATTKPATTDLGPQVLAAAKSSYELGPCVQNQSTPGDRFLQCDFGSTHATKTVVLLGDSQAAMWLPAFDAAGQAHNFHVVLLARLGCNSNPLVLLSFTGTVDAQCSVFRKASLKYIKTLHSPLVFVSQMHRYQVSASNTPVSDANWTTSMKTLYSSLKASGASSTSFIEEAPVDPVDAAGCLARNLTASHKCTYSASLGIISSARAADEAAASVSHVPVINTMPIFCTSLAIATSTQCPVQVNGVLVYADRWHTTSQYAAYSWQALAALAKL